MDLDAYVLAHAHEWQRLEQLVHRGRLQGAESDELVDLYAQVATHLSVVRTSAPDPSLVAHLSSLLAKARNKAVGTRVSSWRGFASFFTERFPAALYRLRWWWLGCMAGNVVVTAVMMLWLLDHPNVEQSLLSPAEIDQLVNHDFEDYYSTYAASHFALQVWINNAWVSALCIAFGILGLPVIYLLFNNIQNLAVIGSIMHRHGHGQQFWGLILPHGLLELTAVFVAGGVGLRLFWSWIEPGELDPHPVHRAGGAYGGHGEPWAGLRADGERRDRGVRDAVRAADLGPGRHRHHRRAGLLRLRVRARPAGAPPRGDRRHRRSLPGGPGRDAGVIRVRQPSGSPKPPSRGDRSTDHCPVTMSTTVDVSDSLDEARTRLLKTARALNGAWAAALCSMVLLVMGAWRCCWWP